jgi:putative membrane protein
MKKNSRTVPARGLILAATLTAVGLIGSLGTIDSAQAADAESAASMSSDQLFVFKATQDGMAEVELGTLAQKRAKDPMVKTFAAMMVTDHTKAGKELSALAAKKGWNVPTALDDEHAKMVHSLSAKPDSEFDNEYARQMVDAHDKAVVLFQDAAAVGDKELAAFAKKTLPTLEKHQRQAAMLPAKRPQAPALDRDPLDRNIEGRNDAEAHGEHAPAPNR